MSFIVITNNAQGMNNPMTQKDMINIVKMYRPSVLCVQETNIDPIHHRLPNIDSYISFFNPPLHRSSGTCIFVQNSLTIVSCTVISKGNMQALVVKQNSTVIHILNVHLSNTDYIAKEMIRVMDNYVKTVPANEQLVLCGDWNYVDNDSVDRIRCNERRKSIKHIMGNLLSRYSLVDCYRLLYPDRKDMTHISLFPHRPAGRLDRIYTTSVHADQVVNHCIYPSRSDHSIVQVSFNICCRTSTSPLWKLDCELLSNEGFLFQIECLLDAFLSHGNKSLRDYETLKRDIRQCAKSTTAFLHKQRQNVAKKYQQQLQHCIIMSDSSSIAHLFLDMTSEMMQYNQAFNKGKVLSREDSLSINAALSDTPHQEQLARVHSFFCTKFSTVHPVSTQGLDKYLSQLPRFDDSQTANMALPFNAHDFLLAIKSIPSKRSPGPDGLCSELYKAFPQHFAQILLWLHNQSMRESLLPRSCRQGVVTLIYKKGDPKNLQNWRPISLSNVDYKIISTVVKNRIINYMSDVIGSHQTCNVKGRTIFDNLHYFRDFFDTAVDGAVLSLDQEAAFDRVNRSFLFQAMKTMNFPEQIISTVQLLYRESHVMVKVGPSLTKCVPVNSGVKPGDPIASALFIISMEICLLRIKSRISPLSKVTSYADDCNIVVSSPIDFTIVEEEFSSYCSYSGGKLNAAKSTCLLLGKWKLYPPLVNFPVENNGIKILGLYYGNQQQISRNWTTLLLSVQRTVSRLESTYQHSGFHLRATLFNVFVLSKLWYALQVLDPPQIFLKEISTLCMNFLWGDGKHWVKRAFVFAPKEHGGLEMLDPTQQIQTFRLRLFFKIMCREPNEYFLKTVRDNIYHAISTSPVNCLPFYKNLRDLIKTCKLQPAGFPHIMNWPISDIFFTTEEAAVLTSSGVNTFTDLFNEERLSTLLRTAPTHKKRRLERHMKLAKNKVSTFITSSTESSPHLTVFNALTETQEKVLSDNCYEICYWQRIWPTVMPTDIAKAKLKCWKSLKYSLSPRERDITWRIRHGAICIPQLAYQMGLVNSNSCYFCPVGRPTWKHIIVCPRFDELWEAVKRLVIKAGVLWDSRKVFTGFPVGLNGVLNHCVNAAYLVVYEMITLKINQVPHTMQPVLRWKQILFDMIYSDFKSKVQDELARHVFENYWRKLNFLFRICGCSIDIRI